MTPEEWNKAKKLFDAALVREPSQRTAFLAENCPNNSVRQEVERLLINFQEAGSFLSHSVLHLDMITGQTSGAHAEDESPGLKAESEQPLSARTIPGADDPMIGRHLGVYKLERRVGQGGMAAVFLAVRADGEFRQQVAIKLILPGLEKNEILSRFRRERQTLADLDHPNIVKLLDGGSTPEGLPYLVMDYVEGSPIDEYCDSHKLSVEQRLRLFSNVCEAVEYAHEKRVVHRDLKPGNILITAEGAPKLVDFGIAKVLEASAGLQALTHTGARCMTPAYASPEQVRGKSVTTATDIYSLGAVLYELLTGHRPYRLKERTPAELERAICEQEPENPSTAVNQVESETFPDGTTVTKTPEAVSQTREGQPERLRRRLRGDLDKIVLKALQKEPERRYSSVEEFGRDIDRHLRCLPVKARRSTLTYRASRLVARHKTTVRTLVLLVLLLASGAWLTFRALGLRDRTPESVSMRIRSLAVLPLADLSAGRTQEYFSDGMTDALITDLAQIGSLKVISRTSSMQYKQTKKSLPEIARELNVDGIIEGTVQRSGYRVHITAQLVYGPSDKHLWAASYERDLRDVLALQRNIADDIAHQVQSRLTTQNQAAEPRPVNLQALEAYLQGNSYLAKGMNVGPRDENLREAAKYFQHAIEADGTFAPAYIGLADTHHFLWWPSSKDLTIMRTLAEKAVELAPASADAHSELGDAKWEKRDWAGAEEEYRRAIALNPNSGLGHHGLGYLLDALGEIDEGWKEYEIAQQLDPNGDHLSDALRLRGEFERAIKLLQKMAERHPEDAAIRWFLSENYLRRGLYAQWVEEAGRSMTSFGFPEISRGLRRAFAEYGYQGALRQWAAEFERLAANRQGYFPGIIAETYAALGDKDRAFYWLRQGCEHSQVSFNDPLLWMVKVDYGFAPLRTDPRFRDILRCMGLPS